MPVGSTGLKSTAMRWIDHAPRHAAASSEPMTPAGLRCRATATMPATTEIAGSTTWSALPPARAGTAWWYS